MTSILHCVLVGKLPFKRNLQPIKLSRPWYGPYQVMFYQESDIDVAKVYYPQYEQVDNLKSINLAHSLVLSTFLLVMDSNKRTLMTN